MTDKQVYSDKYTVESEIARGGMGVVYKAVHTALGRGVALKVLHSQYSGDPAFVQRFLREARAMARLDHAHIIRVFDVAEDAGAHYIVMEYFPATDLKRVILERNELPVDQALEIAEQIAEGLAYAHEQGIVHRDIKPGNIMINDTGQVKIADFGIAAAADEISVTATGQVLGTPEYMSPEQARGDELDGRSDLYSLGMVLYELLTGRTPFKSISKMAIVGKLLYEDAALPLEFPDAVPEPVRDLVRTLLNRDPAQRVADAPALVSRLREVQATLKAGGFQAPAPAPEDAGEATLVMDRPPAAAEAPPRKAPEAAPHAAPEAAPVAAAPERGRADAGVGAGAQTGAGRAATPADLGYAPAPPPRKLDLGGRTKVLAGAGAAGVVVLGLIGYLVLSGGPEAPSSPAPAATPAPAPPAPAGASRAEVTDLLDKAAALQAQAAEARANAEALGADQRTPDAFGAARDRQADGEDRIATARAGIDQGRFDEAKGALEEATGFLSSAIDGFTNARTQAASLAEQDRAADERKRADAQRAEAEKRRLAAEAERRRVEEAALHKPEAPVHKQAPAPGGATASGRPDIEVVGEMLAIFKTAYENRDVGTLAEVSRITDEKRRFLDEIFGNYKTVEVSVSGFNLVQDRATAVVTIDRLVGADGNIVIPSAAWRTAKLSMRKRGGEWQRIEW